MSYKHLNDLNSMMNMNTMIVFPFPFSKCIQQSIRIFHKTISLLNDFRHDINLLLCRDIGCLAVRPAYSDILVHCEYGTAFHMWI